VRVASQNPRLPPGIITLSEFLEPYLSENGAKKSKPIPEWLFDISDANQAALDDVKVFGLEYDQPRIDPVGSQPAALSPISPALRHNHASPTRSDKGKGKERAHPLSSSPMAPMGPKSSAITLSFQAQTPPVPLAQRVMSTQLATQQFNLTQSPLADNEESESDGEIPIVPLRQAVKKKSRVVFDPLAFPQSSGESVSGTQAKGKGVDRDNSQVDGYMSSSDGESNSEGLSDYEREARRLRKRKRAASPQAEDRERPKSTAPHRRNQEISSVEDESIPASESIESFSLTKQYPSPGKTAARSVEVTSRISQSQVAVDHGVHASIDKTTEAVTNSNEHSNESSLPTPPPSDHGPASQLSPLRTAKVERGDAVPKTEPATVAVHVRRDSDLSSTVLEGRNAHGPSHTDIAARVDDAPRPSRRSESRSTSRRDRSVSSALATTTLARSTKRPTWTLDLTVDGLTAEEVEQYTRKVEAARAKVRSTH